MAYWFPTVISGWLPLHGQLMRRGSAGPGMHPSQDIGGGGFLVFSGAAFAFGAIHVRDCCDLIQGRVVRRFSQGRPTRVSDVEKWFR